MIRAARGLLDTSAVIDLSRIPEDQLPEELFISTITLAELAAGPHITNDIRERGRRQRELQEAEALFEALPFDATAAREYGALCAASIAAGRTAYPRRTLDFMIAATARSVRMPLYTRNPSDFNGLEDLVDIVHVG